MVFGAGGDQALRALVAVVAVVADPGLSEHLPPESIPHPFELRLPAVVGILPIGRDVEGVRRRPHADYGLARPEVVVDLLHLLIGQIAKPRRDHHQIGLPQGLEARDVGRVRGCDLAGLRIDRVKHRAREAVVLGQNLRELRERLLAAVFLVAADEHHVLALARPLAPLDRQVGQLRRDRRDRGLRLFGEARLRGRFAGKGQPGRRRIAGEDVEDRRLIDLVGGHGEGAAAHLDPFEVGQCELPRDPQVAAERTGLE